MFLDVIQCAIPPERSHDYSAAWLAALSEKKKQEVCIQLCAIMQYERRNLHFHMSKYWISRI